MNKYLKQFLLTGAVFAGLGPIIYGFILWQIVSPAQLEIRPSQVFLAIVSTYIIAFIQAGSCVFHKIESWSPLKSALAQLVSIYLAFTVFYLINSWIPFNWKVILIYTAVFVVIYVIIFVIVSLITRATVKKLNKKLKEDNK